MTMDSFIQYAITMLYRLFFNKFGTATNNNKIEINKRRSCKVHDEMCARYYYT